MLEIFLFFLAVKIKKNKENVKFKVRCSRYLYTLVIQDREKAEKLRQSLPPGKCCYNLEMFWKNEFKNFPSACTVLPHPPPPKKKKKEEKTVEGVVVAQLLLTILFLFFLFLSVLSGGRAGIGLFSTCMLILNL